PTGIPIPLRWLRGSAVEGPGPLEGVAAGERARKRITARNITRLPIAEALARAAGPERQSSLHHAGPAQLTPRHSEMAFVPAPPEIPRVDSGQPVVPGVAKRAIDIDVVDDVEASATPIPGAVGFERRQRDPAHVAEPESEAA